VAQKSGFALQKIDVDDVATQWQLARKRQNPVEVNLTYTLSKLDSDNKTRASLFAYWTAMKQLTRVEN